jgi:hypothetical protein
MDSQELAAEIHQLEALVAEVVEQITARPVLQ